MYKKVHGYDDRYFNLNHDIDLSWRVRKLRYYRSLFQRSQKRYWSERGRKSLQLLFN